MLPLGPEAPHSLRRSFRGSRGTSFRVSLGSRSSSLRGSRGGRSSQSRSSLRRSRGASGSSGASSVPPERWGLSRASSLAFRCSLRKGPHSPSKAGGGQPGRSGDRPDAGDRLRSPQELQLLEGTGAEPLLVAASSRVLSLDTCTSGLKARETF